jgi:hypothetical protein
MAAHARSAVEGHLGEPLSVDAPAVGLPVGLALDDQDVLPTLRSEEPLSVRPSVVVENR